MREYGRGCMRLGNRDANHLRRVFVKYMSQKYAYDTRAIDSVLLDIGKYQYGDSRKYPIIELITNSETTISIKKPEILVYEKNYYDNYSIEELMPYDVLNKPLETYSRDEWCYQYSKVIKSKDVKIIVDLIHMVYGLDSGDFSKIFDQWLYEISINPEFTVEDYTSAAIAKYINNVDITRKLNHISNELTDIETHPVFGESKYINDMSLIREKCYICPDERCYSIDDNKFGIELPIDGNIHYFLLDNLKFKKLNIHRS